MNPIENVLSGITGQKIPFPEPIGNKAYMELKLSWENEKPGALDKIDGVTCEKCLNRGYTAVLDDDCGISHRECECMVQRRSVMRMKKSGLWELLKTKTFDSYTTASQWQDVAKKRCMHYAETTDNGWLYMGGQSGFGKTHLCTAVCARLMERGYNVSYFLWHDLD